MDCRDKMQQSFYDEKQQIDKQREAADVIYKCFMSSDPTTLNTVIREIRDLTLAEFPSGSERLRAMLNRALDKFITKKTEEKDNRSKEATDQNIVTPSNRNPFTNNTGTLLPNGQRMRTLSDARRDAAARRNKG